MTPAALEVLCDAAREGGASCAHDEVMPIFPVHFRAGETEVTGTCAACGATDFVVWEAYGYRDAAHGDPFPTDEEALAAFEEFWGETP